MLGLVWYHFLHISCPRNGCTTYRKFLQDYGWRKVNLFDKDLDFKKYVIWAHITDPHQRHTKGLHKYLIDNPDINIDDPALGKILVSGVFDEHTYSLNMMLGPLWNLDINWIPLDATITDYRFPDKRRILDGDGLTNDFFHENGINLSISKSDRLNVLGPSPIREKIDRLKEMHHENYQKLVKNFLEPDVLLYHQVLKRYREKYQ